MDRFGWDNRDQSMEDLQGLIYSLNEKPSHVKTLAYAFQWLVFSMGFIISTALILGPVVGLDRVDAAGLLQRLLIVSGVTSLLQVLLGHGLPIIEAPGGPCLGISLALASAAQSRGEPLSKFRTDIEGGLIAAGVLIALLVATGFSKRLVRLFTPAVSGTVLTLIALQVSGPLLDNMVKSPNGSPSVSSTIVSGIVILTVFSLSLVKNSVLRSMSFLIGIGFGWIASGLAGLAPTTNTAGMARYPGPFAWGFPTWDTPTVLTLSLGYCIFLSNTAAALSAAQGVAGTCLGAQRYHRGLLFNGVAQALSGFMSTTGTVSWATSSALISMTGVAAKSPFMLFCLILIGMGLLPGISAGIVSIPSSVISAGAFTTMCNLFVMGLKEYSRKEITFKDNAVIGLSILLGSGASHLSTSTFSPISPLLAYVACNGLVTGAITCIILDRVIPHWKPGCSKVDRCKKV